MMETPSDGPASIPGSVSSSPQTAVPYPWLKSYPPGVDWFATFTPAPLPTLLDNAAARFGSKPATHFLGKVLTYAQLAHQVNQTAKGLQKFRSSQGCARRPAFSKLSRIYCLLLRDLKAGGTVVSFNPLYTVSELTHQAKDARP